MATAKEFKKLMEVWGDCFYENTCFELQAEVIKKLMNCKKLNSFEQMVILKQYVNDLITNQVVVERLEEVQKNR